MRKDLEKIAELIPQNSKVIDVGCGEGELLSYLVDKKHIEGRGIELNPDSVSIAVSRGLSVIQGDADRDLRHYPDRCFDYAVLGQTLQATKHPKDVLSEILRISCRAVISFPNFGHWRNRWYLLSKGRMPVTKRLSYEWYETPNIHFCTIRDFKVLTQELGITIEKSFYTKEENSFVITNLTKANLLGELGIFVLRMP